MNTQEFLENFKEAIESEENLTLETNFRELDEWDSLASLSVIAMLDEEYDRVIEGDKFKALKTIGEIWEIIKK